MLGANQMITKGPEGGRVSMEWVVRHMASEPQVSCAAKTPNHRMGGSVAVVGSPIAAN
jgi:hypothetical protein